MALGGEGDKRPLLTDFEPVPTHFWLMLLTGPEIARNGEHIRIRIVNRAVSRRFITPVGPGWLWSLVHVVGVLGYGVSHEAA
jgi:hypothetical protein